MKNFRQQGDTLTLTPTAAVASGAAALIGRIIGVAVANVAAGEPGEFKRTGVFTLPKATGQAWAQGAVVYWDATNSVVTTTAASNTLIGAATEAAVSAATSGSVLLDGVIRAAA